MCALSTVVIATPAARMTTKARVIFVANPNFMPAHLSPYRVTAPRKRLADWVNEGAGIRSPDSDQFESIHDTRSCPMTA